MKDWAHHAHDDAVRAAHMTSHMLHERSFWGIVLILAMLTGLLAMIAFFGDDSLMDYRNMPVPLRL
jgi:hypothetical protein